MSGSRSWPPFLALGVVTLVAALALTRTFVVAVAAANAAFALPHAWYHLGHLEVFSGSDVAAVASSISVPVIAAVVVWWIARRRAEPGTMAR